MKKAEEKNKNRNPQNKDTMEKIKKARNWDFDSLFNLTNFQGKKKVWEVVQWWHNIPTRTTKEYPNKFFILIAATTQ